jgi:Trypsin-like peptidase domain
VHSQLNARSLGRYTLWSSSNSFLLAITELSRQSLLLKLRFDGVELSTATGFVVKGSGGTLTLVTNWHVFSGRNHETGELLSPTGAIPNEVVVFHNKKGAPGEWVERVERLVNEDGKPLWSAHPEYGSRIDLAALTLRQFEDVDVLPISVYLGRKQVAVSPADIVSVIGFPYGRTAGENYAIWATGFVASEPDVDYDGLPVFLIDCRSRQGQSGSPVIAYRTGPVRLDDGSVLVPNGPIARFLGVYSGRITPESDIGRVWKAQILADLLYYDVGY